MMQPDPLADAWKFLALAVILLCAAETCAK